MPKACFVNLYHKPSHGVRDSLKPTSTLKSSVSPSLSFPKIKGTPTLLRWYHLGDVPGWGQCRRALENNIKKASGLFLSDGTNFSLNVRAATFGSGAIGSDHLIAANGGLLNGQNRQGMVTIPRRGGRRPGGRHLVSMVEEGRSLLALSQRETRGALRTLAMMKFAPWRTGEGWWFRCPVRTSSNHNRLLWALMCHQYQSGSALGW